MTEDKNQAVDVAMVESSTVSSQAPSPRIQNTIPVHDDQNEVDLRGLLFMLWRRKWTIMFIVAAFLITVGVTLTYFIKPLYRAEALMKIESENENRTRELAQFVTTVNLSNSMILSEVEVIRSRSLAREVILKNDLIYDTELNPPAKTTDLSNREYSQTMQFKSFALDRKKEAPLEVSDFEMGQIVNRFLKKISVKPVPGSRVIQVGYTSYDPVKAATITNAIVDAYLEQRLARKFLATQKVTEWLDDRLSTLREQVRTSEAAVEQYRTEKNLVAGSRAEVTAQQLSELNSQLVVAKAKQAEAEARLLQVKDVSKNPERVQSAAEVLKSSIIISLKSQETSLLRELADLSNRYGPKHPSIISARDNLEEIRGRLSQEIKNVLKNIENELEVAQARVKALEQGLSELEQERGEEGKDMIRLRELEREAQSFRLIYDTFTETYKKSDKQEELQEPEAQIISYATVPNKPFSPNKPLIYSLTIAFATFLGIGFSLLQEKLDNAFRSASQLEAATGFPCFELIPAVEGLNRTELSDFILSKPASGLAEAVRNLRTVIKLRAGEPGSRPKVVAMTSSFPGEGKSTLSAWLARISAKSGEKVILVDCDLRRPTAHKILAGRGEKTIVEYLTGQAKLEDIIKKDDTSGAHIIHARSVPNSALDLVDSKKMRHLIQSLRQAYDLVVLDTPASLALSDSRILSMDADQVIYCVYWDETPREVVTSGVKKFLDIGNDKIAFVLTNVDLQRHARYGYGDTAYFYGKYKEYYTQN